jgi:hypothetical protein
MNPNALILSPTGRPVIKIGDNAFAQFSAGEYNVSLEWLVDGRECEPVMAIWPKVGGRGAGCFAICLSSIGKYADPSGNPTREAFIECWRALPTLGRIQLDFEVFRLLDVILRHTPDLIRMPPAPVSVRRAEVGEALLEMTVKDQNGKTLSEDTI